MCHSLFRWKFSKQWRRCEINRLLHGAFLRNFCVLEILSKIVFPRPFSVRGSVLSSKIKGFSKIRLDLKILKFYGFWHFGGGTFFVYRYFVIGNLVCTISKLLIINKIQKMRATWSKTNCHYGEQRKLYFLKKNHQTNFVIDP